jgi:hypothetical protein
MSTVDGLLDFEAKQGEKLVLEKVLLDRDGNPANLTGLTVKFNMRAKGGTTALIDRASCTIVGADTDGSVKFTSAVDALQNANGWVVGEFVTLDGADIPQYFPDGKDEYLLGYITPAIA